MPYTRSSLAIAFLLVGLGNCKLGPPISDEEKEAGSRRPIEHVDNPPYREWRDDNSTSTDGLNRHLVNSLPNRWPNNRVPYTIEEGFSQEDRELIAQAIQAIETNTCLSFVDKEASDTNFVHIDFAQNGCFATLGYNSWKGQHDLNLERPNCMVHAVIVHELLHNLGVKHEQQRYDRDNYITINWSNIKSEARDQYFKMLNEDAVAPFPPECSDLPGPDYSNCYGGGFTQSFGTDYDYTSVMHYQSRIFAIDSTMDVMTATDSSVTSLGGDKMSPTDIARLNAAYSCDTNLEYSGCGGQQEGMSGTLDGTLSNDGCEWNLIAPDGYVIELTFTSFTFSNCVDSVSVYGGNGQNSLIDKFCSTNVGTIVVSPGNFMYINLSKASSSNGFTAIWRAVTASACCDSYLITADANAYISTFGFYNNWLGLFTADGTQTQNTWPVYRSNADSQYWLAHVNVNPGSIYETVWSMNNDPSVPGATSGLMFYGPMEANCPHQVTFKKYFDPVAGPPLLVENNEILFTCQTVCSSSPPSGPVGSTNDHDGSTNAFNTLITYTCTNGINYYSKCQSDGAWSTIVGACDTSMTATTMADTAIADTTMSETRMGDTTTEETTMEVTTMAETTMEATTIAEATMEGTTMAETYMVETTIEETTMIESRMGETTMGETTMGETTMGETTIEETTSFTTLQETTEGETLVETTTLSMEPFPAVTDKDGVNQLSLEQPCAYFYSPNYPKNYRGTFMRWTFKTRETCPRAKLVTEFLGLFEVRGPPRNNCKNGDFINIPWKVDRRMKLCGKQLPPMSRATMLPGKKYNFVFNANNVKHGKGFLARVCLLCP